MNHLNEEAESKPQLKLEFEIKERDFSVAGEAASKVKKTLQQLGLMPEAVRNIAIIIYEAVMNVVIHATHGQLKVIIIPEQVTVLTEDEGIGISNVELAMKEGYSTAPLEIREMGFGAGMGLPNIKQCSHKLNVKSQVGVGTVLEAIVYLSSKDRKS
ncbi:MAG TPA: anti-sigma regulatory factor [Desulfotomaculum sp.]|nr:anti-sigma regulatory factor [Desulfotomaculum sp.]